MKQSDQNTAHCKIGYGLLLDGDLFNIVRRYELDVYHAIGEHQGLLQPPHTTVKRPFEVLSTDIDTHLKILKDYATHVPVIDVTYGPTKWFQDTTAYVAIDGTALQQAHETLLDLLKEVDVVPDEFEAHNFIPHASIALEFTPEQSPTVQEALSLRAIETSTTRIDSVGLFLNIDQSHWVVVAVQKLVG